METCGSMVAGSLFILLLAMFALWPFIEPFPPSTNAIDDSNEVTTDAGIRNIHSFSCDTVTGSEPFFRSPSLGLTWEAPSVFTAFKIEIARDEAFHEPIADLIARGTSCRIPADILKNQSTLFYRIRARLSDDSFSDPSETSMIAWDRRMTGFRIISPGDHPLGKSEASVSVRDASGRVHLALPRLYGDSGRREAIWLTSDDDGLNWTQRGMISLPDDTFAGPVSLALSSDGHTLAAGYIRSSLMEMPRQVVICSCDLTVPEPEFSNHYAFEGSRGLSWRRPFLAYDSTNVLHACWENENTSGHLHAAPEIVYSNTASGQWSDPIPLTESDSGGGAHIAASGNQVLVMWEGGRYRISPDGGKSWNPPLDTRPARLPHPADRADSLRWRASTSTRIPNSDRIAVALIGEHRTGPDDSSWTRYFDWTEIWTVELDDDGMWTEPELAVKVSLNATEGLLPDENTPVHFTERPDISADRNGTLYLVWDETTGIGSDRYSWIRTAYLSHKPKDGRWAKPRPLPAPSGLNSMKPLLGEAGSQVGCDLVWFAAETFQDAFRPVRRNTCPPLAGVMFATDDDLDPIESQSIRLETPIEVPIVSDAAARIESFPRVHLPEPAMSSNAPTGYESPTPTRTRTPTRTPTRTQTPIFTPTPTPSPTITPTPRTSILQFTPDADAHIASYMPTTNFGSKTKLDVFGAPETLSHALIRFPLTSIPRDNQIIAAELELTFSSATVPAQIALFEVTSFWSESTVTWHSQPSISAQASVIDANDIVVRIPVTEIVRDWVVTPGLNAGFMFKFQSGLDPKQRKIMSRESVTPPKLTVWYLPGAYPTPTENISVDVVLNQSTYYAGDLFMLRLRAYNRYSSIRSVRTWLVLDVYGELFFWPSWSKTPEYNVWALASEAWKEKVILNFNWPINSGIADGIVFWGLIQDQYSADYSLDQATFGWYAP